MNTDRSEDSISIAALASELAWDAVLSAGDAYFRTAAALNEAGVKMPDGGRTRSVSPTDRLSQIQFDA